MKSLWHLISSNWSHRNQTFTMALKEISKKYKGTVFGSAWAIFKPVMFICFYWFGIAVGVRGGSSDIDGHPYIFWLISGIIPWFFISETWSYVAKSIRSNKHLVTKIKFPVETIPTYSLLSQLIVHIFLWILFFLIGSMVGGFEWSLKLLQIPYYFLAVFSLMWVITMLTSSIVVISRDMEYLLMSTSVALFWGSPILWSVQEISNSTLQKIIMLNPIYYVTQGFRDTMMNGKWFFESPLLTLYFWSAILIIGLIAAFVQKRLRPYFADVL